MKEHIAIVIDAIKELDSCDEAIVHQGENVEQQIHSQAQEVRTAVDQEERKLTQEVRTTVQQKRAVISLQREEAQKELARLQSSIEFNEWSMNVQSDQQIVVSMTKMLDHMKESISQSKKCRLRPIERVDLKYERSMRLTEECKKLGLLRYSHLSQKCHLTLQPVAPGRKAHFRLSLRENDGSPFQVSTSLISCQLTASNGPQPADCAITETGPGSYEISYTPVIHSHHHLSVIVGGVDIAGSAFSLPVLPPFPEIRGHPLDLPMSLMPVKVKWWSAKPVVAVLVYLTANYNESCQ